MDFIKYEIHHQLIYMDWTEQPSAGFFDEGYDFEECVRQTHEWQANQTFLHAFPRQTDLVSQIWYTAPVDSEVSPTTELPIDPSTEQSTEPPIQQIRPGRIKYNRPRKNPDKPRKPNKTKNFLTFFRNAHRDYLEIYWKTKKMESMKDHPILRRVLFSKGNKVTIKDFDQVYKMRQLAACWISMIQQRYLYRHLIMSRALLEQRLEYNRRLSVFESSFLAKSFERIR